MRPTRCVLRSLVVAALLAGCSSGGGDSGSSATTASSVATTTTTGGEVTVTTAPPATTVDTTPVGGPCELGPVPPDGEITFVNGAGQLVAVAPTGGSPRCVVADAPADVIAAWGGFADRVLIGPATKLLDSGPGPTGFQADAQASWSRPTGTAILGVTSDGRLVKSPTIGDAPVEISFLAHHESAVYHPAGRAIVSVGDGAEGYGIYMADNQGKLLHNLARAEFANHLSDLQWTATGELMFVAEHPDHWDLHRINLADFQLSTVAATERSADIISDFVASPFGEGLAWRQGDCGGDGLSTVIDVGGLRTDLPSALAAARPIGWLPGDSLVLAADPDPCHPDQGTARVYLLTGTTATPVADGARGVSLRVPLPAGPELPASIPDNAPA